MCPSTRTITESQCTQKQSWIPNGDVCAHHTSGDWSCSTLDGFPPEHCWITQGIYDLSMEQTSSSMHTLYLLRIVILAIRLRLFASILEQAEPERIAAPYGSQNYIQLGMARTGPHPCLSYKLWALIGSCRHNSKGPGTRRGPKIPKARYSSYFCRKLLLV